MKNLFSLAYLTVPGTHPVDQIEIAARCGYDGVSLRPLSQRLPGEPDFSLADGRMFEHVKAALRDTGLRLMDIELARISDGIDVLSYEADFEKAAELGAGYAISSIWTTDRPFALEQLGRLCDMAARYDMLINLEFMPFSNVRNLAETVEVLDALAHPNLRLMVDHLHAHRAGVTPEMLRKIPKERLGFVHLCDGPEWVPPVDHPDMTGVARGGRNYVGEGGIDVLGMIKSIPDVPYYSIELPNAAEMALRGKLGHAKRCLDTAKEFFRVNELDGN